jgi:hypothetical protein
MKTLTDYTNSKSSNNLLIILTAAILISCTQLLSANGGFSYFQLMPEMEVSDIPFDTHEVYVCYLLDKALEGTSLPADFFVNDIPFNTSGVAHMKSTAPLMPEWILLPENEVNDIPFNTLSVVQEYRFTQIAGQLSLKAESYINDIPFETASVFAQYLNTRPLKVSKDVGVMSHVTEAVFSKLGLVLKAGVISMAILLGASVLGFLFFSYVY